MKSRKIICSSSYSLGNQAHFNDLLSDEDEEFTYLVPSNAAWEAINHEYASAHKQLFLGTFGYQVSVTMALLNVLAPEITRFSFDTPKRYFRVAF